MIDPQPFLRAAIGISAVGGCVSSGESLSLAWAFRKSGPFSYEVARLREPLAERLKHFRFLFGWPGVLALHGSRVLLGLTCAGLAWGGTVPAGIIGACAGVTLLLSLRSGYLLDGADRMLAITLVACCLGSLRETPEGARFALFFLAAQLSIAYATAGIYKLREPAWHSGEALLTLHSTRMFGRPSVHRFVTRHRREIQLISRAFVAGEILGGLAPWCPPKVAVTLLAGAAAFHLAAAITMGLNTFLFAFPALFPAAVYVSKSVYGR